jgi:repressor LexA
MKGLTKRQRELIDFISDFIASHRYSPSYREIGQHFGFSSLGSVYKHINTLKRKGVLFNESRVSRSVTTVNEALKSPAPSEMAIPLIGRISAGTPIQTFSQTEQIHVPSHYVHSADATYALLAQGNSLNEEMIADGDILIVEARQQAHPGETVVALINQQDVIVKKYYPEGDFVRLLSSHSNHHPILLNQNNIAVQAVMICLLRRYG